MPLLKIREKTIPFSPFDKDLTLARAALVSTTGVHLRSQTPFDLASRRGDPTYREIPSSASVSDMVITHGHYDQADAERDLNVVFPIERLRELVDEGVLGSLAPTFFSFMGFVLDTKYLEETYAPEAAAKLSAEDVDLVILTPG